MQYLFFDIECASVFKTTAKICAFGYCLTDERFRVLKKEDILLNPQGRFHLTDRKGTQGLVLPYSYEAFKNYPTFPQKAKEIYALLQDPETLVVGHAVMNDVKYLNLESKRFSLPSLRFSFADTQFLYMNKIGSFARQYGLSSIAEELGVEFTAHRAVDDAYATMKVAEAMCAEAGCSLEELLKRYEIELGKIENYEITGLTSTALKNAIMESARRKEEKERAHAQFHAFVEKARKNRRKYGKMQGKMVSVSRGVEMEANIRPLIERMFLEGGFFAYRVETCNLYVQSENEKGGRLVKAQEVGATIVTLAEFEKMLKG